jgi:hypothetical protein
MGARQAALESVLMDVGVASPNEKSALPSASSINDAGLQVIVDRVYRKLGGGKERPRIAPGSWDINGNGMTIELDEERHFNRYRLVTLRSHVYRKLSGFDVARYRDYCRRYEPQCMHAAHHGGYWSNKSCEEEFGPPGSNGDLSGDGAPRWKQRAFYDFVKDLAPIALGLRVVRISVWDTITASEGGYRVGELLDRIRRTPQEVHEWSLALVTMIKERASE